MSITALVVKADLESSKKKKKKKKKQNETGCTRR
jgi:hypothetical protein